MMPIKTYKRIETIVLYFVTKKNLQISFQNGPENQTTSLIDIKKYFQRSETFSQVLIVQ